MNCENIQELLSAYFDHELPDESRLRVAEHIKECAACSTELAGFESLSSMADRLTAPLPPESGWRRLEDSLNGDRSARSLGHGRRWSLPSRRLLAMAATILVVMGLGWSGYRTWAPHHKQATVLEHYLQGFQQDPRKAQSMLLAKYRGEAVDAKHAVQKVGYRPAVADGLPEGYSIDSTFVMEMPCCTCVQTLCRRSDGSVLVVFEHDEEQPNWFGGRPGIMANCGGQQCSLVGLDSQLAASWKRGTRHLTIIGARDVAEVDKMVSWLAGSGRASS